MERLTVGGGTMTTDQHARELTLRAFQSYEEGYRRIPVSDGVVVGDFTAIHHHYPAGPERVRMVVAVYRCVARPGRGYEFIVWSGRCPCGEKFHAHHHKPIRVITAAGDEPVIVEGRTQ